MGEAQSPFKAPERSDVAMSSICTSEKSRLSAIVAARRDSILPGRAVLEDVSLPNIQQVIINRPANSVSLSQEQRDNVSGQKSRSTGHLEKSTVNGESEQWVNLLTRTRGFAIESVLQAT